MFTVSIQKDGKELKGVKAHIEIGPEKMQASYYQRQSANKWFREDQWRYVSEAWLSTLYCYSKH